MAPKRSRKVVGTVVKTTKKVVQETLEVAVDVGAAGSEEQQKATEVVVEEKGVDGVPVVVVLSSAKETVGKGVGAEKEKEKNDEHGEQRAKEKTGQEQGKERVPEAADAKGIEKKSGRDGVKRRRKRRGSNVGVTSGGYKRYVFRVLKQVHPGMGASSRAMVVLEGMMVDMFERIAEEAGRLSEYTGKVTLSSREIQDAVRLVLPGELGKHAISEGVKAVKTYMDAD